MSQRFKTLFLLLFTWMPVSAVALRAHIALGDIATSDSAAESGGRSVDPHGVK